VAGAGLAIPLAVPTTEALDVGAAPEVAKPGSARDGVMKAPPTLTPLLSLQAATLSEASANAATCRRTA
jgi:hypothetical protein